MSSLSSDPAKVPGDSIRVNWFKAGPLSVANTYLLAESTSLYAKLVNSLSLSKWREFLVSIISWVATYAKPLPSFAPISFSVSVMLLSVSAS